LYNWFGYVYIGHYSPIYVKIIKSIFVFLLIGSSVVFVGLPVSEIQAPAVVTEQYQESMALISILALLGVATFIIILLLEKLTKLKLWKLFHEAFILNPRQEYLVKF
jgi:hypothetical protein